MSLFSRSWAALRGAVAELPDEAFARPSGCADRLVRDLVCHLVIDAQDVLITLATPADAEPTRDALTYREVSASFSDADALPVGIGRRAPSAAETAALGPLAERLPLVLGRDFHVIQVGIVDLTAPGYLQWRHEPGCPPDPAPPRRLR